MSLAAYLQKESVQTMKRRFENGKDRKEKVMADEMVDDLIYLAELIDFTGIVSCLAVRGTLSERMTDKLTDSIAGMADEVLENGRTIRIRQNNRYKTVKGMVKVAGA